MNDPHTLLLEPARASQADWFPTEQVHIFPLQAAPHRKPRRRPLADPPDPFGPENFSARWWPGDDPSR